MNWLSNGFQAKEAKSQLTLWSEPVLKGVTLMFAEPGHAGKAQKTHMRMRTQGVSFPTLNSTFSEI